MGVEARIENEKGVCLQELSDPEDLVADLLPKYDDESSICLRFIDLYGDTTFNELQMPILIKELIKAIDKTSNNDAKEHGKKLLDMAKKVSEEGHLYLKFYGD